ncbi:hypothetical protein RBSH_05898 [Rhodopirellula baltica SH28]|uniref:Uncharacterized protein n=1 Tax=Rhodopirellula baltica SH28 TaxID=993517 RepID=K5DZE7_RHOBT|nr:hypothetical protein RBSH_05898 [Rhodopirellula baltica SH28]
MAVDRGVQIDSGHDGSKEKSGGKSCCGGSSELQVVCQCETPPFKIEQISAIARIASLTGVGATIDRPI